jgi:class 3 adenylate cyclase
VLRALRNFRDQAPELQPWLLKFTDGWLERRFQDEYFDTNLQYIRIATFLGAVTWAAFGPLAPVIVHEGGLFRDAVIRYGVGVPIGLVSFALTYLPNYRRIWQALVSAAILLSGLVWVIHRAVVPADRPDWGYAGNMVILIFAYILSRLQFRYSVLIGVALIVMYNVGSFFIIHESTNNVIFGDYFLLLTAFIGSVGAYVLERSTRLLFLRERELDRERGRSEGLLRNILPEQIADRLKERDPATEHGHIVRAYDEVTVVFADLVEFTTQSGRTDPPEIVTVLDDVFTRFDAIAERCGLEKIKTIGDAYMAVAGVPEPRDDDVEVAAQMALAMRDEIAKVRWPSGDQMRVRIGMATGPAVAGVIGQRKFAYDLWGDTVNTASRMESEGVPGSIQVSPATYELIKDAYVCEARGPIPVKGKAEMLTYLIISKRAAPGAGDPGG